MSEIELHARSIRKLGDLPTAETAVAVRDEPALLPDLVDYDPSAVVLHDASDQSLRQADPYYGAGDLDITDAQRAILTKPFPLGSLEILPTGEVYLPQIDYRRRLNEALGIGKWALRPLDSPKVMGKTVTRWYALYVNGKFAADTYGEADYIESNPRSSWATALESAKSNALMRCCKDIGVNLECWDKDFTEAWKANHATREDGKWKKRQQIGAGSPAVISSVTSEADDLSPASVWRADPPQPRDPAPSSAGTSLHLISLKEAGKAWAHAGVKYQMFVDDKGKKWKFAGEPNVKKAAEGLATGSTLEVEYVVEVQGKFKNNVVVNAAVIP